MSRRADYQAALERWNFHWDDDPWRPKVTFRRARLLWRGSWEGPRRGKHVTYGLTRAGVLRGVERECARWTRAVRRSERRRRVRQVVSL